MAHHSKITERARGCVDGTPRHIIARATESEGDMVVSFLPKPSDCITLQYPPFMTNRRTMRLSVVRPHLEYITISPSALPASSVMLQYGRCSCCAGIRHTPTPHQQAYTRPTALPTRTASRVSL